MAKLFYQIKSKIWNRCDYCGKFIGFKEFQNGKSERKMVIPESELTIETYETYHIKCKKEYYE